MTNESRRFSLLPWGGLAIVLVLALLPWWRNHHYLRDLYDYGLVIAANGHLDRGQRPYVDFTTPIQAGFLGMNWAVEQAGGGTYAALTHGAAGLILASGLVLPLMLARRWPVWAAALVGGAVTVASASQHTILWHNALGVFCLAVVSWSTAIASVLQRVNWPWHLLAAAGLFLGGINKLNFHLVAVAAGLAWALRAGLVRRVGWGRVVATMLSVFAAGVLLPLAAELAWTGASLQLWLANVVQLAANSRLDTLPKIGSVSFLLQPIHDYYGPQLPPQAGLFGLFVSLAAMAGCWPGNGAARADRWLVPAAALTVAGAGAALLATNFEIASVGLGAWLVLAASLWLGFAPTRRRAVFLGGLLLPALALGFTGWRSAWLGQRSQFGYSSVPRSEYVEVERLNPAYARLAGLRLPPDFALSLELLESRLPERGADGRYPVFYGAGLEFADRFFPGIWEKGQQLWMHWGTTYGPADRVRFEARLAREKYFRAVLCTVPFDYWPGSVHDLLQAYYVRDSVGPVFRQWIRRDENSLNLRDSIQSIAELGGNVDGRVLHLHRDPLTGRQASDGRRVLGTVRPAGQVLVRTPVHRVGGMVVLDRQPGAGDGPLMADVKAIVHGASPEDVRWTARLELPAGQQSLAVPFHADGSGKQLLLWITQPAEQSGKLLVGLRDLEITHAADAAGGAPVLQDETMPEAPPTLELAQSLFGDIAWRPQQLVTRGGRPGSQGLELPSWGELWLHTSGMTGEIRGRLTVTTATARPTLVRVLWYKSGRLQILQHAWVRPDRPTDFRAWTAEPGGWIGWVVERAAGAVPVEVRIVQSTLTP
ncbi:MAG: hypothetical protein HYV95_12575 [Opitutae bacterium]|nr:hypothetical protein [Opitutae bacterium]